MPKTRTRSTHITVETNNVMSLPLNHHPAKTIRAGAASIKCLQEINGRGIKKAARHIDDFKLAPIGASEVYAEGVLYKPDVWRLLAHRTIEQYRGVAHISYTRHFYVAEVEHIGTGERGAIISFHAVTHPRGKNDKARKRMRREALRKLRATIKHYRKLGYFVVVCGDYNEARNVHPTATVHVKHRIDHIYAWSSKTWRFKRRLRKKLRHINTPSDHDALVASFNVTVKEAA